MQKKKEIEDLDDGKTSAENSDIDLVENSTTMKERSTLLPAGSYPEVTPNWERDVLAETEELLASLPEVTASPKEDDMLTAEDKDEQPVSLPDTKEEELFKTPEVAPENEAVPGTV